MTWEPRTQALVEWDTAPTSPTRATEVPLARQPQPPLFPPPCRPFTSQALAPIRRVDRPDYGRNNDTVNFPLSFSPTPFEDLEPGTTNENELLAQTIPSLSFSTQIGELVSDLQTVVDTLEADVKSVINKQEKLREASEQPKNPTALRPSASGEQFSWDRVRVDPSVLNTVHDNGLHEYVQLPASSSLSTLFVNAVVEVPP